MIPFWLALAVMAAIAALGIGWPLWRATSVPGGDQAQHDHLRRLREFEQDVSAGDIAAEDAPALRAELERAIVDALRTTPAPAPHGSPYQRMLTLTAALLVPALALGVYLHLGQPSVGNFVAAHPELDLSAPAASVELLLDSVRRRVADEPTDREAWTMLARSYLKLARYEEAVAAAEHVVALAPRDSEGLLLLTDAVSMRAGGALVPRALALLEQVLEQEADNVTALVLKGIALAQRGERAPAVELWQRAYAILPADAPLRSELQAMIEGATGTDPATPETAPATDDARVSVDVALAPELANDLDPETIVFILARSADNPGPPLAVMRRRVAELPLSVTLDETMAMMPGRSLRDFDRVYVVARIARSGQPQASSGDLEGRSTILSPTPHSSVSITIDKVLP